MWKAPTSTFWQSFCSQELDKVCSQGKENSGSEEATWTRRHMGKKCHTLSRACTATSPEPGHISEAEAELRAEMILLLSFCGFHHSPVVSLPPIIFQLKCCLPLSQESFHILLTDQLLGIIPHLKAQNIHKHHLAPLYAPRLERRLAVLDGWLQKRKKKIHIPCCALPIPFHLNLLTSYGIGYLSLFWRKLRDAM